MKSDTLEVEAAKGTEPFVSSDATLGEGYI